MSGDPDPAGSNAPAPRRAALLVNALARSGARLESIRAVRRALARHGLEVEKTYRVWRPGKIGRVVDALLDQGFDRLIVGGGDGTVGAVAPHLAGGRAVLGVLPMGTANDFARTLEIPRRLDDAAAVAAGSHVRAIDLARADDAYFLNVASVGMSVTMIGALSPRLKRWLGPTAYAVAGARAFFRHPTFRARVTTPAGTTEGDVHQLVVANGRFFGGGVLVARDSTLDDGQLVVYALGARGRWQILSTMTMLKLRVPLDRPGDFFLSTPVVRVETWPPYRVNLDGELRATTPATFEVVPGALRVLAPEVEAPAPVLGRPGAGLAEAG